MTIHYSIIIPHKDIPNLLQRCLDSIPQRDDVEVIVVDDNSDPRKVDFSHFPQWKGKHYQYFLTQEGKGPGCARNVGLDHAQGRWVVFADADDFFTEDFGTLLDEMVDAEADVVFFDYINVLSEDVTQQLEERVLYRNFIAHYLNGDKSEFDLRTRFVTSCCKLVKRELIEQHHIRFDEVKWGEDVYFAIQIGYYAQTIKVSGTIGYVVTSRTGQITENLFQTATEFRIRMEGNLKCDDLLKSKYGSHVRTVRVLGSVCRKRGFWRCVWFGIANVFHPRFFGQIVLVALLLNQRMIDKKKKKWEREKPLRTFIAKIPLAKPLYHTIKDRYENFHHHSSQGHS